MTAQRDMPCALEYPALVPGERAAQEVVTRIPVGERIDIRQDQSFPGVRDQRIVVDGVEWLLFVILAHQLACIARGVDRLVGRKSDAGSIGGRNARLVSERA